jgi:hypothetical protein
MSPKSKSKRFSTKQDKPKERSKVKEIDSLPASLSFCFSASGQSILMWRRNGHCIIRIEIPSRSSDSLPIFHAIPEHEEGDRSVNLKLVAEGHGWIAAAMYYQQVSEQTQDVLFMISLTVAAFLPFNDGQDRQCLLTNALAAKHTTDHLSNIKGQRIRGCRLRQSHSSISLPGLYPTLGDGN